MFFKSLRGDEPMRSVFVAFIIILLAAGPAFSQQGVLPITPREYDANPEWKPSPQGAGEMARVDWREYLPAAGYQGRQNSCTGWAVAYAVKTYQEVRDQGWQPDSTSHVFSPAFVYNQLNGGTDSGAKLIDALNLLKDTGCATLATMSYSDRDYTAKPSRDALAEAAKFRCGTAYRVASGPQIRNALQEGKLVVIAVKTDPVFSSGLFKIFTMDDRKRGLSRLDPRARHGYHAMCVVGYDDTREAFLLMNSWGTDWGQKGFCWVSYDVMKDVYPDEANFVWEAYVQDDVKQKVTDTNPVNDTRVTVKGTSWYGGYQSGSPAWKWTSYIEGSPNAIANIQKVVWYVPDGRGKYWELAATDPNSAFSISATRTGAGKLTVTARVFFKDKTSVDQTHSFAFVLPTNREMKLVQTDRYWGRIQDQPNWLWTLYIDGNLMDLADISQVTYHLHPSFPNPDRVVQTGPENGFAFSATGWGTFTVGATVEFLDGTSQELSIGLKFNDKIRDEMTLTNTSRIMGYDEKGGALWAWTASIDGPLGVLRQVDGVRYELHPTFNPNVVDINQGADYGFPLSATGWGTFKLKATIFYNNGTSQEVDHMLEFTMPDAPQQQDEPPRKKAPQK
jgi:transcription initiation factor IIF auxiliary subunit